MTLPADIDRATRPVSEAWEDMERGTDTSERYQEAQAAYREARRGASRRRLVLFLSLGALAILVIAIGISVIA